MARSRDRPEASLAERRRSPSQSLPPSAISPSTYRPATSRSRAVKVPPFLPLPLCRTALAASSLFTELAGWFSQVSGHADGFGVRDFYLRAGYVLLPCSRTLRSPVTS